MNGYDRYRWLQRGRRLQLRQCKAQELTAELSTAGLTPEATKELEDELKAARLSQAESRLLEEYTKDGNPALFLLPGTV